MGFRLNWLARHPAYCTCVKCVDKRLGKSQRVQIDKEASAPTRSRDTTQHPAKAGATPGHDQYCNCPDCIKTRTERWAATVTRQDAERRAAEAHKRQVDKQREFERRTEEAKRAEAERARKRAAWQRAYTPTSGSPPGDIRAFERLAARRWGRRRRRRTLLLVVLLTGLALAAIYLASEPEMVRRYLTTAQEAVESTYQEAREYIAPPTTPIPTPTPPVTWQEGSEESASGQIRNDRWVGFSEEPQVCNGVLTAKGQAKNGAAVSYLSTNSLPFVLYREADLAPRPGFGISPSVPPIAGFLKPLTGSEYYPLLSTGDIVADVLLTPRGGSFELVADWPEWLPDPEDVAFGVWGYRPGYGEDNIRLITVSKC